MEIPRSNELAGTQSVVFRFFLWSVACFTVRAKKVRDGVSESNLSSNGDVIDKCRRSALFFREIAEVDILDAWARVNAPVLAFCAEYDDRVRHADQETIARIVNERHPDYAESRELARLDHCWTRHASLEASPVATRIEPRPVKTDWSNCPRALESLKRQLALQRMKVRYRDPYNARHSSVSWNLMIGKNPLWVAKQHGHSVQTMLRGRIGCTVSTRSALQ